jgi:pimeloyl-ACP methyl ester carboxylesterase
MSEAESPSVEPLQKISAEIVAKKGGLIEHPFARFNLNLDGQNPDWHPAPQSGLVDMDHTVPDGLRHEMGEAHPEIDAATGQMLNTVHANWDRLIPDTAVTVFEASYHNAIEGPSTFYRGVEIAHQMPDTPFIMFDDPSEGGSDPMRKEQKTAKPEESYFAIADAKLRILAEKGIKKLNLVGQSKGAFGALAMAVRAHEFGMTVENLELVELPGTEDVNLLLFGKRFMGESKYLDLYQATPLDPEMVHAGGLDKSPKERNADLKDWVKSAPKSDPRFTYARSMSKKTAPDRLHSVIDTQPDAKITLVNGTLSSISRTGPVRQLIADINAEHPGRVREIMYPGEPHSVMESAKRFGSLTKQIITGTPI